MPYGFEGQIIPAFLEVKMKKDTYLRIVKMQAWKILILLSFPIKTQIPEFMFWSPRIMHTETV